MIVLVKIQEGGGYFYGFNKTLISINLMLLSLGFDKLSQASQLFGSNTYNLRIFTIPINVKKK